jgi:hypothetical protein
MSVGAGNWAALYARFITTCTGAGVAFIPRYWIHVSHFRGKETAAKVARATGFGSAAILLPFFRTRWIRIVPPVVAQFGLPISADLERIVY